MLYGIYIYMFVNHESMIDYKIIYNIQHMLRITDYDELTQLYDFKMRKSRVKLMQDFLLTVRLFV